MSSKKLKVNINQIVLKRDSFSHRICDDLCEVLLSYLSLEDKFRFECVSKQFQTCVYNKQNTIELFDMNSRMITKNSLNKLVLKILSKNSSLPDESQFNLKAFESVLKKCKFINNIDIDLYYNDNLETHELILQLVNKYCFHLTTVKLCFIGISLKTFREFGLKFGQKLRSIDLSYCRKNNYKMLFKLCPNLESINYVDMNYLVENNQKVLAKLQKVTNFSRDINQNSMKTFVDCYQNSFKSLEMYVEDEDYYLDIIREVSRLNKLVQLNLTILRRIDHSFVVQFKNIAINCTQINKLVLHFEENNLLLVKKVCDTFSHFKELKFLDLNSTPFGSIPSVSNEDVKHFTIESLKDCKQLTHLKFDSLSRSDHFIKDIHLYLPQLTYFHVRTHENITNDSMNSLSQLKQLKVICFEALFDNKIFSGITDSGLCHVINNCPQIQSIRFNRRPKMTSETIDALIGVAFKNPHIYYNHFFGSVAEDLDDFPVLDIKCYKSLPNNINITVSEDKLTDDQFHNIFF